MMAQNHDHGNKERNHASITELVDDLNASQKRKVEAISKASKERVDALRKQKHAVCDSISVLMDKEGNHSKELNPLFEREAELQVAINREMYDTKCRIDEILTPDQRGRLREACKREKGRTMRKPHAAKPEINPKFIKP